MESGVTFIGFGEAAMAFATAGARGYDLKLDDPALHTRKLADFARCDVTPCDTAANALSGAKTVMSLVTADQALIAARDAAPSLVSGAIWLDMNSVAPDTKRVAAAAIGTHGRYVDVAVMSPVEPARLAVPLLVSGSHAEAGAEALVALGFSNVRIVGHAIGDASAIKMIRSVMVKGIEALSAECALAAEAAGVRDEVIASLDASWPGADWGRRFDYNLDRMMIHGERRSAEMEEVVTTLDALGTGSTMSRATVELHRAIGVLRAMPPAGLAAKLRVLLPFLTRLEKAA
jgi:3-hydroxyisobutyrate dehydrogenase-like beta-hydroxyacid dehydrogenase